MSEHTSGPWESDPSATFKIRAPKLDQAVAYLAPTNCDANARLIAAAPRMYEKIESLARAGDEEAISILEGINGHA